MIRKIHFLIQFTTKTIFFFFDWNTNNLIKTKPIFHWIMDEDYVNAQTNRLTHTIDRHNVPVQHTIANWFYISIQFYIRFNVTATRKLSWHEKKHNKKVFKHRRQPDRSTTDLSLFFTKRNSLQNERNVSFCFCKTNRNNRQIRILK